MTFLVTGGAGFIGSHLVAALLRDGHTVRVLDDFSTGRIDNLAPLQAAHGSRLDVIEGTILDPETVGKAVDGVEFVAHQAAHISVADSLVRPAVAMRINTEGTAIVLEAARKAGVRAVTVASSAAVYGDEPTLPKRESMRPAPISPYAASKLAAEHLVEVYARTHGLPAVALRYFNVFGPRQDPKSPYAAAIPIFLAKLHAGVPPTIFDDGDQTRDFVNVLDIVNANRLALTMAATNAAAPGRVWGPYNIASGDAVTINGTVALLQKFLGTSPPMAPHYAPARPGDIRHSLADISAARAALGYTPQVPFPEGIRTLVADWLSTPPR